MLTSDPASPKGARERASVDVIVRFDVSANPTFSSLEAMETELENIFARKVDLITYQGIENSLNYLRRKEILSSAQVIYAKRRSISA